MSAYYNEVDGYAAQWLRNLIAAGHIAPGDVDERNIEDVQPDDVRGYTQCHWFAGIGGWSLALRLAGWGDDAPAWSGSCPCQPFSSAGKGRGKDDARHLWPQFRRLIRQCRPPVVFGEQVTSTAGRVWLSSVCADLEALAYRAAGADLCAPSVGAFDIRQRLWFVADTNRQRRERQRVRVQQREPRTAGAQTPRRGEAGRLADSERWTAERSGQSVAGQTGGAQGETHQRQWVRHDVGDGVNLSGLADSNGWDTEHGDVQRGGEYGLRTADRRAAGCQGDSERAEGRGMGHASSTGLQERERVGLVQYAAVEPHPRESIERRGHASFWADAEWIYCRDDKWRPVEPGTFPLATRVPNRVGRLRGYGNAIKPELAAEFVSAYMDILMTTTPQRTTGART